MSPSRRTTVGKKASGSRAAAIVALVELGAKDRRAPLWRAGGSARRVSANHAGAAPRAGAVVRQHREHRAVPAESAEAKAQAERDEKGITRPGYVRRDLANTTHFQDVTYQAGENREVPKAFADHLDLTNVSPDASTEANRETKFGGGKENDQAAQGKSIKAAREGAPAAQRKHQQSDAFQTIGGQKKQAASRAARSNSGMLTPGASSVAIG
jgi:hypothetical protein